MCIALQLFAQNMKTSPAPEKLLFDFVSPTNATWQIVNDDVMGGVSTCSFQITNSVAIFRGELSLENNGGFASVRTMPAKFDLGDASEFVLRVRGDGRRYKFTARTESSFDSPLYQSTFATAQGEWQEIRLPLKDFVPTFRGRVLTGESPLSPGKLTSIGFLISDKQAGPFRLEVAWIKVTCLQRK
jgi:monofunctional biosynthetic peptidoglycan transglycosylase